MFTEPLESIFTDFNLEAAFAKIHSKSAGIDGITPKEYQKNLHINIQKLKNSVVNGVYAPEPMLRMKLPKDSGGFRPIAISSIKDKIVQNVISAALTQYFDKSFSNASYAYRPGKNHIRAIHRTRDYILRGYECILKSDIESFFENINHDILISILAKNISDAKITNLISLLLQNGLFDRQSYLSHTIGTHQGDSLSPLLSNIYLDAMDKKLEEYGFAFVRYADDFVVLGKTEKEIENARNILDAYLPTIKLQLSVEKTKIISKKEPFTFLGARFCGVQISIDDDSLQKQISHIDKLSKSKIPFERFVFELNETIKTAKRYLLKIVSEDSPQITVFLSAVIEHLANKIVVAKKTKEIASKQIFREKLAILEPLTKEASTLPTIAERSIAKAYETLENDEKNKTQTSLLEKKKREYAERYAKSSTLFIAKAGMFLGISKNTLSLKQNGMKTKNIPINQIKNIVVSTRYSSFSSAVVEMCAKNSISIDFMDDKYGHYAQLIGFNAQISELAHMQLRLIEEGGHLYLAKEFIEAKSKNQLNYLKYIDRYHEKLGIHISKIENTAKRLKAESVSGQTVLMGYEGEMSAVYWDAVKVLLGEDVFASRVTHGASDKVNSALNYGYAILYGRAQKALVKAGLALHISFLHSPNGRKPTLVFDFVEEFRAYVVDKTVIAMASKSEILAIKDGRLTDNAKKTLAEEILARLGGYIKWKKESRRMDDIIEEQAYLLARHIRGEAKYNGFIGKY